MTTTPLERILSPSPPPHQTAPDLVGWLRGRSLSDLGAIEIAEPCLACGGSGRAGAEKCDTCDGDGKAQRARVLVPGAFEWRNARGEVEQEPVYWAIPRERDYLRATSDAVQLVAREHPRNKIVTADDARGIVGAVRFENLDNAAIVARSARSRRAPHGRLYLLQVLVDTYDPPVIHAAFEQLDVLYRLWDVRVGDITEEQFWALVAEVARVRNVSPFAVLAPALQRVFTLRMACELQASRTQSFSSGSSTTSMPDSSAPTTSE